MVQDVPPVRERNAPAPRSRIDRLVDEAHARLGTEPRESLRLAQAALRSAVRVRYATGVARAHLRAGQGHWQLGEYGPALEQFEQALIASRRARDRTTEAMAINGLGVAYDRLGHYEVALACFERFVHLSPPSRDARAFVMATVNIGHVLERTEQFDEAARRYEAALDVLGGQRVAGLSMLWMNHGVCLSMLGRHAEAAPQLERALEAFVAEDRPLDALLCRLNLAETRANLGEDAAASGLIAQARADAARLSAVHLAWRTHLIDGLLQRRRRRAAAAVALLTEALGFSERCDEPDLLRLTHQELSEAHEALGNAAAALHHHKIAADLQLRAARALAHAGAQHALQATLRETAALLGGGAARPRARRLPPAAPPPKPARRTTARLSAREQEVVQRLAQGLSNRAIGEALGISTFTARYHVSSIFNKLGVATRGEAVLKALGAGLITLNAA